MIIKVTTNIHVEQEDYISFRTNNFRNKVKNGRAIGELIEAEVKRQSKLSKGNIR